MILPLSATNITQSTSAQAISAQANSAVDDGGCISVHCKRHLEARECGSDGVLKTKHARGGWPKAHDEPVYLTAAEMPVLHVFDCSASPLYVMLRKATVLAMWSFGGNESDARSRQAEATLLPCNELL